MFVFFFNALFPEGFSFDTEILTKEGYKKIGEIKAGSYVLSFDENGSIVETKIVGIWRHRVSSYIRITVGDAFIETSSDQLFRDSNTKQWIEALHFVSNACIEFINEPKDFISIALKKNNNFFVSKKHINVHNWNLGLILAFSFDGLFKNIAFETLTVAFGGATTVFAASGLLTYCIGLALDRFWNKAVIAGNQNNPNPIWRQNGFGEGRSAYEIELEEQAQMMNIVLQHNSSTYYDAVRMRRENELQKEQELWLSRIEAWK